MDLEECSKSKPEEWNDDKNTDTLEKITNLNEIKVDTNGGVAHEEHITTSLPIETENGDTIGVELENETPTEAISADPTIAKENGDEIGVEHDEKSPSNSTGSAASKVDASNLSPAKGYGLKKWRRIRRNLSKDAIAGADPALILKRRLPLADSTKARDSNKQKSDAEGEDSVASMDSRNALGVGPPHAVASGVLDAELGLQAASSGFSVGADSDNSEERSSKSSTAASAPRLRHESVGSGRERSRARGFTGRGSGHALQQRGQRGRGGGVDTSKKFRGDQLRFEKENSHSSSESDLRSSNAAFTRRGSVVSSNGKQSERYLIYDGEHSDEAQACEEVRSGYYKENGRVRDTSREDLDADHLEEENIGKGENYQSHTDLDPFAESIVLLHAAQEALEKEIQKIGEIGKGPVLEDSNGELEGTEGSRSWALEAHFLELTQKIKHLERKLEETSATINAKESMVLEFESVNNKTHSPKKQSASTDPPSLEEGHMETGPELEGLFKKKIEAEIEYLIIASATQTFEVLAKDQTALFKAQRSLVEDQAQMMVKLRSAEDKAALLMRQAEELEAQCKELLGTEEVLKLHNKVCKFSLCCFVQLVMLCLAVWWFLAQLLPLSDDVVPT